jgi:hypothetical protein
MRRLLAAWLPSGLLAVSSAAFGQAAFDGHVKVGVEEAWRPLDQGGCGLVAKKE